MTLDEAKVLFPKQDLVNDFVGYIYVTFNVDEGLFYIGKQTRKDWCDSYYGGGKFPKQWLKEGKKLEHWPIQWCFIKEEINQAEFEWIDKFKNHKDIRNITVGGKGTFTPINDFAKQIRSDTFKGENNPAYGKHLSEETKKKISDTKKEYFKTHDGGTKGKHLSEEHKQKLKEAKKRYYETHDGTMKGKKLSQEAREKISKSKKEYYKIHEPVNKGQHHTDEAKKLMSELKKEYYKTHDAPMKGRKHSEEAKQKMREKAKNRKGSRCKAVRCIETGEIFESARAATKSFGADAIKNSQINKVCNNECENAFGYHWEWVKDE